MPCLCGMCLGECVYVLRAELRKDVLFMGRREQTHRKWKMCLFGPGTHSLTVNYD